MPDRLLAGSRLRPVHRFRKVQRTRSRSQSERQAILIHGSVSSWVVPMLVYTSGIRGQECYALLLIAGALVAVLYLVWNMAHFFFHAYKGRRPAKRKG